MDLISKKQLNRLKKSEKEIISEMDMMTYRLIANIPDIDPKNDGDQDDPNDEDKLDLDNPEDFELKKEEDEIVIDKLEPNEITTIPEEEIQEGVINKVKSVPDFEHNVDSWKKKKNRFLFITGVSGSGKTTQAKKLSEEYKANLISLDELGSNFIDSIGQDKIDKMNEIEYSKAVCNYVIGIHKSGQVVIEGVGFLEWFEDIPSLKNQSYIIKGTSYLKSNVQAAKRDKKTAKNFIRDYFKNQQPFTYYSTRADELVKILGGESRILNPISETQFMDPFLLNTLYASNTIVEPIEKDEENPEDVGMFDIPEEEEPEVEEDLELTDTGKKLELISDNILETLSKKERAKLKANQFGIPSLRKYPLHDEAHVIYAVKFFNKVDKKYEKELADNIIRVANKLDIPLTPGENNRLKNYVKVTLTKKQDPPKKDDVYNVATSETFELSRIDEAGQFKTAIGDPHIKNVPTVVVNDKDFVPFYVVLTSNDTHIAKVIKTVTKEPYNHASFSTDPNLKILYSFARRPDGRGGFVIESTKQGKLFEYMHAKNPTEYAMFVTFISMEKFEKVKERLNNMIDNIDAYKYKFMQLIRLPLGIKNNDNNAMICSEFVGNMLKEADESLIIKHPSLLTPYELINPKFHFVSSGLLKDYKPVFTKKKVAEILKSENISQFITENVSLVSKLLYDGSLSLLKPYTQRVFDSFFPFTDVYPENLFSMTIGGLGLHMPFTAETDFDDLFLQYNSAVNKFASIEDEEHNRFALYIQNIYYSLFIRTDLNLLNSVDMDTLKVLDTWLDRVKLYYSQMLQKGLSEEDVNSYKQKLLDIMWYYKEDPNSSEIVEFRKIKLAANLGLTASAITDSHIEYDEIFRNYIDISNIQEDVFLTLDKRYPVFSPYDLMRSAAYFSYLEDFDKDYFVEQWCKKYLFYGCKFKLTSDMQIADYVKSTLPDIINDDADILNSNAVLDVNIEGVSAGNVVVSLDDDGNLLIKKKLDADMNTVYRRALRNIKIYKDTNNLDALKYEVALLDYMAQLIEVSYITPKVNKLYKNDKEYAEKRKEMLDLRAIIINSYSQSLKFILEKEPTFNYREYYNTTPFSKDIKLTKNEILTTVRLTKEVVKLITGL